MIQRAEPLLNALWIGGDLPVIHVGCLLSAMRAGHQLRLFCYEKPSNTPAGVELANAADVLPPDEIMRHAASGSPSLATNLFRYRLQQAGLGPWIDTDVFVLKPLTSEDGYMFGWQDEEYFGSAVLALPKGELAEFLCEQSSQSHPVPFWYNSLRKGILHARKVFGVAQHASEFPWGLYGPHLLTHAINRYGLAHKAMPSSAFYPIGWEEAACLYQGNSSLLAGLPKECRAVHLWHQTAKSNELKVEPGSFIDQAMRLVGVSLF